MKRIALLLVILLLPVFCVAGFYGFLWWRVTDAADEIMVQISPLAELSYGDVHIDLVATEISLTDIRVAPLGGTDQFNLDEISLKAPDWSQMLRLSDDLSVDSWPDALSLRIKGFFFRLDGALMQGWMDLAQQEQPKDMPFVGQFCSSMQGSDLLQAMGYRMLGTDLEFSYSFDAVDDRWNIDISAETAQLGDFSMGMSLKTSAETLSKASLASSESALRSVESYFRDTGFNRRYREYCASQSGVEGEQFDQLLSQEFRAMAAYAGLALPDELHQGLVAMYRPGASGDFSLHPDTPLGQMQAVHITSLKMFVSALNPSLQINGQPVSLAGIQLQQPARALPPVEVREPLALSPAISPSPSAGPSHSAKNSDTSQSYQASSSTVTEYRPAFRAVSVAEVGEHIGRRARMVTYFGRHIEGRILEIDHDEMLIEQRMQRGVATYSIALKKVAELEVYR